MTLFSRGRGVVLRATVHGEASKVLDLLLEGRGLQQVRAQNALKSRKRFSGVLEPFTSGDFVLRAGSGRPTLESVDHPESRFGLSATVESFAVATCVCEWLLTVVHGADGADDYVHLLEATLDSLLGEAAAALPVLLSFELSLLGIGGVLPDVEACAGCGAVFTPSEAVGVCLVDGTLVHPGHGGGGTMPIPPDGRAALRTLWGKPPATCARVRLSARQGIAVARVVEQLLSAHLGVLPRSRGFAYQVLLAGPGA